jgi:hypothetical protein
VERDTPLPHCERLIFVCNASGPPELRSPESPTFEWTQAADGRGHPTSGIIKALIGLRRAKRRFLSCERCNELADLTIEMFETQAADDTVSGEAVICQPGRCSKCSAEGADAAYLQSHGPATDDSHVLEYYDPLTEQTEIVLVEAATLEQAQERIVRCEHCTDDAEITFDYVLDAITGCDPTVTQYVLYTPAKCPHCLHDVNEKTLVIPD